VFIGATQGGTPIFVTKFGSPGKNLGYYNSQKGAVGGVSLSQLSV